MDWVINREWDCMRVSVEKVVLEAPRSPVSLVCIFFKVRYAFSKTICLAGFGLGALNDADEDDLDVYDGGATSNRRREAYDVTEHEKDDTITIGGKSVRQSKTSVSYLFTTSEYQQHSCTEAISRVCSVFPGWPGCTIRLRPFTKARFTRPLVSLIVIFLLFSEEVTNRFPIPDVPTGWKPNPRRVWEKDKEKENVPSASRTAPRGRDSKITADEVRPNNYVCFFGECILTLWRSEELC